MSARYVLPPHKERDRVAESRSGISQIKTLGKKQDSAKKLAIDDLVLRQPFQCILMKKYCSKNKLSYLCSKILNKGKV